MSHRRLARCLLFPVFLLAAIPACQSLHRYRPVVVQVRDIETKKPIPGAEVRLWYPLARSSLAPWESTETTADDGIARLRAAPYGEVGVVVDVTAKGYMMDELSVSTHAVEALEPPHLFEDISQRPVNFIVELYSEPLPKVELLLPAGFRGLVRAEVRVQEDVPCPPGQRLFPCTVPESGVVTLTGPPLLRRVVAADFHAKYPDGTLLTRQPDETGVGFWWVRDEGRYHCFLVATASEYQIYKGAARAEELGLDKPANSGKGGGKGRRNRGGDGGSP